MTKPQVTSLGKQIKNPLLVQSEVPGDVFPKRRGSLTGICHPLPVRYIQKNPMLGLSWEWLPSSQTSSPLKGLFSCPSHLLLIEERILVQDSCGYTPPAPSLSSSMSERHQGQGHVFCSRQLISSADREEPLWGLPGKPKAVLLLPSITHISGSLTTS